MERWGRLLLPLGVTLAVLGGLLPESSSAEQIIRPRLAQDDVLFDLLLRSSSDPDLLSARQAVLRQRLIDMGIDPLGERQRPTVQTMFRRRMADKAGAPLFEAPRQVEILEIDWRHGHAIVYRFPEISLFFTEPDTNVVGVAFSPPRDMANPALAIQLDSIDAWTRHWGSIGLQDRWAQQLRTRKSAQAESGQLLNFRIPVKLPRTLERIIGKGEATNIQISGQETISISGESTRRSDFIGNEVQQRQSLFPTLEMRQSLRVNLDGTVGEKIKVRVTHDSEAIGGQATQVRLSFEGDEDDIIQVIRAGDIDVTLPGSRLLGVSAQRGGLFGVKVEGALGALDFTVVTSKEQSQENRQTFSQSGGTQEEFIISSTDFIKNRFFRVLAPSSIFFPDDPNGDPLGRIHDQSLVPFLPESQGGRGWTIDPNSIEIYVNEGPGVSDENIVDAGYAFLDVTGLGFEQIGAGVPDLPLSPLDPGTAERSERWRRLRRDVDWSFLVDSDERVIGIAMARSYQDGRDILACSYRILDASGVAIRKVGRSIDDPEGARIVDPNDPSQEAFVFKLLKPYSPNTPIDGEGKFDALALTWEYAFRHYYDLRGRDIQPDGFEIRIERNDTSLENPQLDQETKPGSQGSNLPWIRVFGLDRYDQTGNLGSDNQPDIGQREVFDLVNGYLQFPMFTPFDPDDQTVQEFTDGQVESLDGGDKPLSSAGLYGERLNSTQLQDAYKFNIIVRQTSVSSRIRINAFNIKEGSEEVILDGRVLSRDVDYVIDYFSGEINLLDQPLNAQSNIQVRYEIDPLFGGGRTSLNGFNLGYRLGERKTLSTTWLLQSQPNSATKPRLGEEPSRTWVGNVAGKFQFSPGILRAAANLLPLVNSDDPAQFNLDAEVAMSAPNPNTREDAYLEDFEAVDQSVNISLGREGWVWASLPAEYTENEVTRDYGVEDRAYAGWHRPVPGVTRGDLNPTLSEQERRDVVPSLEMRVVSLNEGDNAWSDSEFAGIMRSLGTEVDLTEAQFLEFWLDDLTGNVYDVEGNVIPELLANRVGTLHFDFGTINEDFWWKPTSDGTSYLLGEWDREDRDNDGLLGVEGGITEDTGLDGLLSSQETGPDQPFLRLPPRANDPARDDFSSEPGDGVNENQFPYINGTEGNQRLDSEDLSRNNFLDLQDGYFSIQLELSNLEDAIVDVYRDFSEYPDFVAASELRGTAWRKYRLDLRNLLNRVSRIGDGTPYQAGTPDLSRVRYFRVWYEAPAGSPTDRKIRLAEMRFLGNRWLNDNIRDLDGNIVPALDRPGEDFRVGVVNNKDNPEYVPPVFPDTRNNVAEKEQSLQFVYTNLQSGHQLRTRRDLPGRDGQDYTVYEELNFFWRAPYSGGQRVAEQDRLEAYYWIGSDSLNYYEIAFQFSDVETSLEGWQECRINMGEMTNVKNNPLEPLIPGSAIQIQRGFVLDPLTGERYRITVRGRPDLRRVQRFYAGVRYPLVADVDGQILAPPLTGDILFNEIRLKSVNRELGFAQRYAVTTQIPGLGELSMDYSQTDEEFRGLNQRSGSQIFRRDWSGRASSRLQSLIPTLGLDVPFSVNLRRSLELPKYLPRSDVELLNDRLRQNQKTTDQSESFNFQVRKPEPSRFWLWQYTLDRFSYSFSGSQSERQSPTQDSDRRSTDTKYNYDLRVRKGLSFGLPFVGEFNPTPQQLTLASAWRYDEQNSAAKDAQGDTLNTVQQLTKQTTNNLQLTFQPTRNTRGSFQVSSNRNRLLGEEVFLGIDWGKEETFQQRWNLNWKSDWRILRWLSPEVDFNASYQENRRPGIRQRDNRPEAERNPDGFLGEAGEVRHLNNNSDLTVRGKLNLTGWLKKRFGRTERRPGETTSTRQQQRDSRRIDRRRTEPEVPPPPPSPAEEPLVPGAAQPDSTAEGEQLPEGGEQEEGMDPFRTEPSEAVDLFEQAQQDLEERRAEAQEQREEAPEEEVEPPRPEGEEQPPEETEQEFDPGGALKGLLRPFANLFINMQAINASYQRQSQSNYQHVNQRGNWLYRLGFSSVPEITSSVEGAPEGQLYSSESQTLSQRLSFNTQSQLTEKMRLDLSYQGRWSERAGIRGDSRDYSIDFPDATLRISGVHAWRIFGNLFSASNLDFTYKRQKSAQGITDLSGEFPRIANTFQPRWTFRFQNGLDANLNITWTGESSENALNRLNNAQLRGNLKLQKSFDAEGALGFLRFGRKGTGTTIDMTIDIAYVRQRSNREIKATGNTDQERGNTRMSLAPNFSYQFSRNLRGGLRLSYSRDKDIARDATTTSIGLGMDATLTF